jgi:hypothetical protein
MANHGDLAVITAEVVKQCSQMVSHESPGKFMVSHSAHCRGRKRVTAYELALAPA